MHQELADSLLSLEKHRIDDTIIQLAHICHGGSLTVPLIAPSNKEEFLLDIERNRINLLKGKYQTRVRGAILLARLDFGGAPHRNPDGQEISCPHLHLYRENYGMKWAFSVPSESFPDMTNLWQTLFDFMNFCNITEYPHFERGLF